ncbi:hypothetical protein DMH01_06650 [Amycolatopsis sp. WAC 04182]|uniref:hypothetical protein n=1 Tax=Amycolatopsis sp. WAC 04182 TaxID=2203198 RepID=UPI0010018EF8|nr:hypothetical protein [Amycolatopsis sp. WAC 04182]RSN66006.1 hypothetical protein DMH01_06650 [Amycolatopsis sp. WAC 04182]
MQQQTFQQDGLIALDAYPYRALKRGKQCVAVFVERSTESVTIVALGRVVPGDMSGASNRNLEFDFCRAVTPAVSIPPDTEIYFSVTSALESRTTLPPDHSDKVLSVISQSSKHAAHEVECLRSQTEPNTITGNAGFLLACEQDAVALSLKAANLHAQLSKLSTWAADSPDLPFITGLAEAHEPEAFRACHDHQVLRSEQGEIQVLAWMRLARDKRSRGPGVTLVNVRPVGDYEPTGVDLVYLNPKFGALALLHYSSDRTFPQYVDEIDRRYASEEDPTDPRLAPRPGFVKFTTYRHFEASKERLLGGNIHVASDLRGWERRHDGQFASQRHLSNSTFAALLGGGWLGGRKAGYKQAREVIELVLQTNRAVIIAVHSDWNSLAQHSFSNQRLF